MNRSPTAPSAATPPELTLTIFGLMPAGEMEKSSDRHPAAAFVSTDTVWDWPPSEASEAEPGSLASALGRRPRRLPIDPPGTCADDLDQRARQRLSVLTPEAASIEALRADLADDPSVATRLADNPDWVAVSRIEPVHLQAGTDHAVVFGPRYLNLSPADWAVLARDLNAWLAEDGLYLFTTRSGRHYLAYTAAGLDRLGDRDLPPLPCALNRNVQPFLSEDAVRPLRRWLTELQMWLYAHPLNAARAARGQPELNSMWLSGRAGLAPVRQPLPSGEGAASGPLVYTDSAVLAGALYVERGAGSVVLMPHAAPNWVALMAAGYRPSVRPLHLVFTEPAWCYLEGDVAGWANALDAVDAFLRARVAAGYPRSFALDDGQGLFWSQAGVGWRAWLDRLGVRLRQTVVRPR